ncbi:MAG: HRDC domain-containing protein [Actinomycetota bacterium]|nr:HRDC domain-containing protein [Actinomycetota bacterium]
MSDLINTEGAFSQLIDHLLGVERYALDTEFHRERTYWPDLALVQVAWPAQADGLAGVALIDPLAVDFRTFATVLTDGGTLVAHAADQDLEVLYRACGVRPRQLFDTQIAAAFLGHGLASLSALAFTFLDVRLQKGDRLTDWSTRPLSSGQLAYAADDVAHLLDLADAVAKQLSERGRLSWVEEECELLRLRAVGPNDPSRAWWKLRDGRQLRAAARGVAQEVAAWRELRAREVNQPVRFVLPDLGLQAIVHGQPVTVAALRAIRGLDGRHLRGDVPSQILAAVIRGRELPETALNLPPSDEVDRNWRPAVALAAAWIAQLARDERIDASLLATRVDLVAFLSEQPGSRLATGWRAELVGRQLARLVGGDAALAFEGAGRLVLETRSRQGLDTAAGSGRVPAGAVPAAAVPAAAVPAGAAAVPPGAAAVPPAVPGGDPDVPVATPRHRG